MISHSKYTQKLSLQRDKILILYSPLILPPHSYHCFGSPLIPLAWRRCHTSRYHRHSRGVAIVGNTTWSHQSRPSHSGTSLRSSLPPAIPFFRVPAPDTATPGPREQLRPWEIPPFAASVLPLPDRVGNHPSIRWQHWLPLHAFSPPPWGSRPLQQGVGSTSEGFTPIRWLGSAAIRLILVLGRVRALEF